MTPPASSESPGLVIGSTGALRAGSALGAFSVNRGGRILVHAVALDAFMFGSVLRGLLRGLLRGQTAKASRGQALFPQRLRGVKPKGFAGSSPVLQPIMPLDLPVKVRSWELTVYPRSHIRRWLGVTRPAQARM